MNNRSPLFKLNMEQDSRLREQSARQRYSASRRRKVLMRRIFSVLAAFVVFFTTYALIMPVLAAPATPYCGQEEHVHDSSCMEQVFVCGYKDGQELPDGTTHTHTDDCYKEQLTCGKEEHTHTLACYSNPEADVETAEQWEKTLPEKLDGSDAENFVSVAKSQVGYKESEENYQVAEDGKTKLGFSRYGAWNDEPYANWSMDFSAFCISYAGIEEFPVDTTSEEKWIEALEKAELIKAATADEIEELSQAASGDEIAELSKVAPDDETAKLTKAASGDVIVDENGYAVGDLVFLSEEEIDGVGVIPHMGIVSEVSAKKIKVIEGDYDNAVVEKEYRKDSDSIIAVAMLPADEANEAAEAVAADGDEGDGGVAGDAADGDGSDEASAGGAADGDAVDESKASAVMAEAGDEASNQENAATGSNDTNNSDKNRTSSLVFTADDYIVTAAYEDNVLPAGADLVVEEIRPDGKFLEKRSYKKYKNRVEDMLDAEVSSARFFDITFEAEGKSVEPDGNVQIVITTNEATGKHVKTVHLPDDADAEVVDSVTNGNEVSFTADSFSVYGLVETTIEKTVLASDGHNYKVTVSYGADAGIPENADLSVEEVLPAGEDGAEDGSEEGAEGRSAYGKSYEEYVADTEHALGMEEGSAGYIRLFDIKIVDKDDHSVKYQPAAGASVDVQIELADRNADESDNILSVVHFADGSEEGDKVDAYTETGKDGQIVSFAADGFSVYAITDKGPIRTYSFYSPDASGNYAEYYFLTDTGESVYQQKIKTVDGVTEELIVPQLPSISGSDTSTFAGWYVFDPSTETYSDEIFDFSNIPEVTSEEEIILRAKFADFAYVIFHEQYNGSTRTWPIAETRRGEKTDGSTTIEISDVTVTYDDSESEENSAPKMAFRGWSLTKVDAGAETDENGNAVQLVNNPITITENTDLYPVFVHINWLTFSSGPTGSGATYVPPRYYYTDEGEVSFPIPVRTGYTFDGWYTAEEGGTKIVNADGTLSITGTEGSFSVVNNELRISDDVTLYGHWTEANTKYTVVIWRQKATDGPNLADADKQYDFAESFSLDAVTGDQVSVANIYKGYAGNGDYSGFHYGHCDDTKTVVGNGSTVLNVYYDRNVHTLTFGEYTNSYTPIYNPDTNRKDIYGYIGRNYIELTYRQGRDGTYNWYYSAGNNYYLYTGGNYYERGKTNRATVTGLYGSSVKDYFPIVGTNGTTYTGYYWEDVSGATYQYILSTIETMPDADVTFVASGSGTAKTIYYYVEVDSASESDGTSFNDKYYTLYKTVQHNYAYITYDEEYHPIAGYVRDHNSAFPVFNPSNNQAQIGTGNVNYLYYDKDTFNITFTDSYTNQNVKVNGAEVTPVSVKYNQKIAGFVPEDPESTREGYRFTGWYADSACSTRVYFDEDEYNNSTDESKVLFDRMPAHNLQLFAGWETEWYLIEIDPNGGEMAGTQSTWFWEPYNGDPIEEYKPPMISRNYQESLNGTWYYAMQDRAYYGLTDEWDSAEDTITERRGYYTQDVSDPAADLSKKYEKAQDAYRYVGWYEVHEDGSETLYAFGQPVMHNTKLRLHWKQMGTYYIRYDAGQGTLDDQDNNEETFHTLDDADYADHANIVVTRTAQAPEGMSFVGWKVRGGDGTVYYPGQSFEFQSLYAFEETENGVEKEYLILDAVYSMIGSAKIIYDANGGSVDTETVNYGAPTDKTAYRHIEADETTATISGLLNNSGVTLSTGVGFALEGAEFRGWNTKADATGEHFAAGEDYYVDKDDPVTLYAEWQVKVYFDKNNVNADWGGNWDAVDENDNRIYTWDETRQQYYTYAYVNGTVDEPAYVPVSTNPEERFAYWSPVRYTDSGEVAYEYDFGMPVEGELTLYGFWANAIQVPYHVVDASNETLVEKNDWKKENQEHFVVNTGTNIPLDSESDAETYVNKPSGYEYAFACVSNSLENCSEENIITNIGYNAVTKRVSVTYTDGRTEDLSSDKEIYLVYFENPKTLAIEYKLMATDSSLTDVTVNEAAPTSATVGAYDMTSGVTAPLAWAGNPYQYYSFAIGDKNAANGSQLHMITGSSGDDEARPQLQIRNTWRGYQYSTDSGNTWVNYGYDPELYVVYYESEPTIVTIKERTIGTQADMDEEFEYDVVIETTTITKTQQQRRQRNYYYYGWGDWSDFDNYGDESIETTSSDILNTSFNLSNGESESITVFYTPALISYKEGQKTSDRFSPQYNYRAVTTTITTQTITVTQRPKNGFTTTNDGNTGDHVYVYSYTTTSTDGDQEVTYTNTRTKEDIELHVALAQNGGFVTHDSDMRTTDERIYMMSIPNGNTVSLSETNPSGLFTGDTDNYHFAGIIYGKADDNGTITAYYTDINSVSFKPLAGSEYLGVYMNDDPARLVEEGYGIYYVYYPVPKIVYMKEGANGVLTRIDPIKRNGSTLTLNGVTVAQDAQLEVGTGPFVIDQSASGGFRVPPDLDGENALSLNYVKLGAGAAEQTNISDLDGISALQNMQLKISEGQMKYSFDGDTWSVFSGDPAVYVIYKEKGYDLTITKTVSGNSTEGEFVLTISSPAITESSYSISGYAVEQDGADVMVDTIAATPAEGSTPGTITLKVKHGMNITISALQKGTYKIEEPGLTGYMMEATVGGYPVTVTDNITSFVLNADTIANITNKPSTVPLKILKVDQTGNTPVEGAVFYFVGKDFDDTEQENIEQKTRYTSKKTSAESNEAVIIEDDAVPLGTYTLHEEKAPAGYNSLEGDVEITIVSGANGTVEAKLKIGDNQITNPTYISKVDGTWVIKIMNSAGVELPSTGGRGTRTFYILGMLLVAGAATVLFMKHNKQSF